VVAAVSHGRWLTTNYVAGLRESGITAPLVIDGSIRGEIVKVYVEQMLAAAHYWAIWSHSTILPLTT